MAWSARRCSPRFTRRSTRIAGRVIGSMRDITAASREDIADFFRRYYHPANASLCIAGDFDPTEAKRLVEKYFGPIPAGPKVTHPKPSTPELKEEKRIKMTDRVGLARVYYAWPTPRQFTADDAALELLGHVLGGGKTSRLFRALVREKQIAQDVQAYQVGQELTGEFTIVATVRPGHSISEVEEAIAEQIARIKSEPPTAEELERAVNIYEAHIVRSLESVSGFRRPRRSVESLQHVYRRSGLHGQGFCPVHAGRCGGGAESRPAVSRSRPRGRRSRAGERSDDRAESAGCRRYGPRRDGHQASLALPEGASEGGPPQVAAEGTGRDVLPEGAAEPKFASPPIQRAKLANGMQVLLVEKHQLPTVNLHVVFPAGKANDGRTALGLADMTAAVWDEGTTKRSAEDIASQLGDIGATLSVSADWNATSVRLFSLKRHLPQALDIMVDVLREPTFPQPRSCIASKLAILARLAQIRNEPTMLASLATGQYLYGGDHPYGHPQWGNPPAIKAFKPDDLKLFYQELDAAGEGGGDRRRRHHAWPS